MNRHTWLKMDGVILSLRLSVLIAFALGVLLAECEAFGGDAAPAARSRWSTSFSGGYAHQLDTDINGGGSFSVNRFGISGSAGYAPDGRRSVSIAVGYNTYRYDFAGNRGLAGMDPWDNIDSLGVSTPIRWGLDNGWNMLAVPTVRFTAESGADLEDAISGGGLIAFSRSVNERLTLGPGIGVMTRLEDHPTVFPFLIVNWKLTETLSVGTGGGAGAAVGPGLALSWNVSDDWDFVVGASYERLRFRLDDNGLAPKGIGEDRGVPLFAGVTHSFDRRSRLSLLGGVKVGGELRLENKDGHKINEQDYDTAGFVRLNCTVLF
jgi:hypothetical protein